MFLTTSVLKDSEDTFSNDLYNPPAETVVRGADLAWESRAKELRIMWAGSRLVWIRAIPIYYLDAASIILWSPRQ